LLKELSEYIYFYYAVISCSKIMHVFPRKPAWQLNLPYVTQIRPVQDAWPVTVIVINLKVITTTTLLLSLVLKVICLKVLKVSGLEVYYSKLLVHMVISTKGCQHAGITGSLVISAYHTTTTTTQQHPSNGPLSRTTRVSQY